MQVNDVLTLISFLLLSSGLLYCFFFPNSLNIYHLFSSFLMHTFKAIHFLLYSVQVVLYVQFRFLVGPIQFIFFVIIISIYILFRDKFCKIPT